MSSAQGGIGLIEEEARLAAELEDWFPRKGDKLFVSTSNAAVVDCTGFTARGEKRSSIGRHDLYADGYLLAADKLVESLQGLPQEDALIYPILYLYRHHVELALKGSIYLSLNWLFQGTEEERKQRFEKLELTRKHGISELWRVLKGLIPGLVDQMGSGTTEAFESLLGQVSEHDSSGQAGRYPFDRKGQQTLMRVNEVDLNHLRLQFKKMSHYLGALDEGIHQEIEAKDSQDANCY